MKKLIYSLLLILGIFIVPNSALAESCNCAITGNKSITVGGATTVYVKVNASNPMKGADINFEVSGNIALVSASPVGLNKMAQNGNRYILYSNSGVKGGSNIFAIKVKGTAVGSGTVKVSSLETTISDETVVCSLSSAVITVKEAPKKTTTPATPAANNDNKTEAPKEEKKEIKETKTKAETDYDKALILVERAEKTRKKADVTKAKAAIDELEFSEKKYNLVERLLKINIESDGEAKGVKTSNDMTKVSTDVTQGMSWFFLAIILLICLAVETLYILFKEVKKNEA